MASYHSLSPSFRISLVALLLGCFLLLVSNFVIAFKYFTMRRSIRLSDEVSTKDFARLLDLSVSNFFASVSSGRGFHASPSAVSRPSVVCVSDLGCWDRGCSFGGVRYGIGDYSEYGELLAVRGSSAYWRGYSNNVVITKSSYQRVPFDPWLPQVEASAASATRLRGGGGREDEATSW